jgi:outer membrane protein TolC
MGQSVLGFLFLAGLATISTGYAATSPAPLSLEDAIEGAMRSNPEIAEAQSRARAEKAAIRSHSFLEDPHLGFMREKGLTEMEQSQGPMSSWSISQGLRFPAKYFVEGSAQGDRAQAAEIRAQHQIHEVWSKTVSAYYELYASDRILQLLEAQKETLREVARIAERRHSTGTAAQQDEMKAHVEQTRIENDLLVAHEERDAAEASVNTLINRDPSTPIASFRQDLAVPAVTLDPREIANVAKERSRPILAARASVDAAHQERALAWLSFAPDFRLSYRHATSGAEAGNYAASIEMSIPLWFPVRQSSLVSEARARAQAEEDRLATTEREVDSRVRILLSRVTAHRRMIDVYRTALIPQASSTLSSSRSAYSAGRASFADLLDSERSLYQVRMAFFRTLSEYVDALTGLEALVSRPISDLPHGDAMGASS